MFRKCQRWQQARYLFGHRGFHLSPILAKRVTRGSIHDVFDHSSSSLRQPLPRSLLPDSTKQQPISLEPRLACTGSVVLDAVREYTSKYPDCVLLMQVGDFYEVSSGSGSIYIHYAKGMITTTSSMKHMHHNMHRNWI